MADRLTPMIMFMHAAPLQKLVIAGLLLAALAAVAVCIVKLRSGARLSGGSAYLSGLRVGGPLVGALGALYNLLHMWIGVASLPETPPLRVLAPGFAESTLMLVLGLFAGSIAVAAHWAVEARIDRTVLRP